MPSIISNINVLLDKLFVNKTEFAKSLGISPQSLYMYMSGRREFSNKFFQKIQQRYPHVNINYLKTGKGDLFIYSPEYNVSIPSSKIERENQYLKVKINLLEEQLNIAENRIADLEKDNLTLNQYLDNKKNIKSKA